MNFISNIWKHPKTSVAGLLIAVIAVTAVFLQQNMTFCTAGTDTLISLASAIASALLGLMARDPKREASPAQSTAKLGAWTLIALLMPVPLTGCSTTVAQEIVNWTPALESAVATVDSAGALLAPADAPAFAAATVGFDAAASLLVTQAKAYLANPSAGLLTQLQNQIVTFQQQVNAALVQAGKIVNPASQQHALAAIQAVGVVVSAILALIQSVSSRAAVARMAAASSIKLSAVRPYLEEQRAARMVAEHYQEPVMVARIQMVAMERGAVEAGF